MVVTSHTLCVLHLHMVGALPIYSTQLPDSLQMSNFSHRVLALLKWETSIKPFGIDKLFQLLPFASFSLLGCHGLPLPRLAFLAPHHQGPHANYQNGSGLSTSTGPNTGCMTNR